MAILNRTRSKLRTPWPSLKIWIEVSPQKSVSIYLMTSFEDLIEVSPHWDSVSLDTQAINKLIFQQITSTTTRSIHPFIYRNVWHSTIFKQKKPACCFIRNFPIRTCTLFFIEWKVLIFENSVHHFLVYTMILKCLFNFLQSRLFFFRRA